MSVAEEIAAAVAVLARHRIRALVLWDPASEITDGVFVDAVASRELLVTVALPEYINKLVGTVVIHGDRIQRAGAPITWATVVEQADDLAIGVAVAVDENSGEIWIADRTGRIEVVEPDELADVLRRHALEAGPR